VVHRCQPTRHRIPPGKYETEKGDEEMMRHLFALALLPIVVPAMLAGEVEGLPEPGEPRRVTLTAPAENTLPNGLRVIVIERPGLPLLGAQLMFKSGVETDPPTLSGLTQFTAGLLKRGTKTRAAPQIAQDIEALGAKIEVNANWDATTLSLTMLSANAGPALAIVAELVRDPAFAIAEIERSRRETLDELRVAFEEPAAVGRLTALRATLPFEAHPPGGTPASVARYTRETIVAQHARLFRPENAILLLAGNIAAPDAFALAEKLFGPWKAATDDSKPLPRTLSATVPRVVIVDMPHAGQAAVFLAVPAITRGADDWFPGKVANAILGGGYTSRLNQEIRLKRGLSYGASSTLSTRRNSGVFLASAQTKNESALAVVRLMQTEIGRLTAEPVSRDFLQTRQSVLIGALARSRNQRRHCPAPWRACPLRSPARRRQPVFRRHTARPADRLAKLRGQTSRRQCFHHRHCGPGQNRRPATTPRFPRAQSHSHKQTRPELPHSSGHGGTLTASCSRSPRRLLLIRRANCRGKQSEMRLPHISLAKRGICRTIPARSSERRRYWDGWQSGRLRTPGKRVYRKVTGVRIPPHPLC
jgi:zinc protease